MISLKIGQNRLYGRLDPYNIVKVGVLFLDSSLIFRLIIRLCTGQIP